MAVPEISAAEAHQRLDSTQPPRLIDVREPSEWELCHIAGAVLLPLPSLAAFAPVHLPSLDESLLLLCHHGVRSAHAAVYLQSQGYTDVTNVRGGIEAWACEVDPTLARY